MGGDESFNLLGEGIILHYKFECKDEITTTSFDIVEIPAGLEQHPAGVEQHHPVAHNQLVEVVDSFIKYERNEEIILDEKVSEVQIEVLQHLPVGKWKSLELN